MNLKPIAKEVMDEVAGILQPMVGVEGLSKLNEAEYSIEAYATALRTLLEDDEITEEIREEIREKLYRDIGEPLNAIHQLLNTGKVNETILKEKLTEDFKVNTTAMGIVPVSVNGKGTLSGDRAVAAARASLGIRETKKITLFRSGFWIAIGDISNADIVNLEKRLSDVSLEVIESRLGLEYTSDIFIYLEIIRDFINEHLIATSLNVPLEDTSQYIKLADTDMLYAGIIESIEPRGFTNYFKCKNAIEIEVVDKHEEPKNTDEEIENLTSGKVKCDATFTAKLHLSSQLRVAEDRLTSEQRLLLTKEKNKTTLEELTIYQEGFTNNTEELLIEEEDLYLKLILKPATMNDTITLGKILFDRIERSLNRLSVGEDSVERRTLYKQHYNAQALAVFTPYIESYHIDEGTSVTDMQTILDILSEVTANDVLSTKVSEGIVKYIDSSLITIYGVPEFTCEKCNKSFTEEDSKDGFEGFTPINLRKYFFTLLTLRG